MKVGVVCTYLAAVIRKTEHVMMLIFAVQLRNI